MDVDQKKHLEMDNIEIMQQMELISHHVTNINDSRMEIHKDIDSFTILYSECAKCTRKF